MKTLFGRLSWLRLFRRLRRRPTPPIRRNPLQLDRLDDRIAPGSVLPTAAAQALTGVDEPALVGWIDPELAAGTTANAEPDAIPLDTSAVSTTFSDSNNGPASQSALGGAGLSLPPVDLTPFGEPGDDFPPFGGQAAPPTEFVSATGTGSPTFASDAVGQRPGVASISVGLSAPPTPDASGPATSPRSADTAHAATTTGQPRSDAAAPGTRTIPQPAGHFASRLQALLHAGDSSGSLSLSGAVGQQSQIGAMIGSQLTSVGNLGASSTAHRPASLFGQTMSAGTGTPVGLRTSKTSSGPFGLVGTQSIGDLMSGPVANGSGGLSGAAGAITDSIPAAGALPGFANRPANATTAPPGVDDFSNAVVVDRSAKGKSARRLTPSAADDPFGTPPTDGADFRLTEIGPSSGDNDGKNDDPLFTVTEQGTINFLSLEGYEDYGNDYLGATVNASVTVYSQGQFGGGTMEWTGNATPTGLLLGFDLDQFNRQNFGVDANTAVSYTLDVWGTDQNPPAAPTDTTTTTHTGTDTHTEEEIVNDTTGTADNFVLHVGGPGNGRQVTWDDTVTDAFTDNRNGNDADSADPTAAAATNDQFGDQSTVTETEVDHAVGAVAADGTFQLTSFSIDQTTDADYSDWQDGHICGPETGGSESDHFTNSDTGHDHQHTVVTGSPDSWTATFDDTDQAGFNDIDNGSESSQTQPTGGETDTNSDGFHEDDSGTHTDALHLEGNGTSDGFTATAISDRIEDVSAFHDNDDGTAGETKTGETDSDHYHGTDNGDADEVLTITGDADRLTAAYTDTGHDNYTDSDAEHDGWSDAATHDTGHDDSTDGDNGSETVNLSMAATLRQWQVGNQQGAAAGWQLGAVNGTIRAFTHVTAGDNGSDDIAGEDSQDENFTDSSSGTEWTNYTLTGTAAAATLQMNVQENLSMGSEDDTGKNWDDPVQWDGEATADIGNEQIDDSETDTTTVQDALTRTIAADGTVSAPAGTVTLTVDGTAHLTDNGTDNDDAADGLDDDQQIHDDLQLGQDEQVFGGFDAGGTDIDYARQLNGTVNLNASEDKEDPRASTDVLGEDDTGNIRGNIGGEMEVSGRITDGQIGPMTTSGQLLDLNLQGSTGSTKTEKLEFPVDTFAASANPYKYFTGGGDSVNSLAWPLYGSPAVPDPGYNLRWSGNPGHSTVTVTTSVSTPTFKIIEDDGEDEYGLWQLGNLDYTTDTTTSTNVVGTYTNSLYSGFPQASGHGERTDSTESKIEEKTQADGLVHGTETLTTKKSLYVTNGIVSGGGQVTGGTTSDDLELTDTEVIDGSEGAGGRNTANLTDTHTIQGHGTFVLNETWTDGANTGNQGLRITSDRDYHDKGKYQNGQKTPTDAGGSDRVQLDQNDLTSGPGSNINVTYKAWTTEDYRAPNSPELPPDPDIDGDIAWPAVPPGVIGENTDSASLWWEIANGNATNSSTYQRPIIDNRDWFAKASDFAAGMGDAVSCGLTQKIRAAAGYDDVVDKNGACYMAGQIAGTAVAIAAGGANPCAAGKAMALAVKGLSAVQGVGQLANAAEAYQKGDALGFALNVIGARMSMSKLSAACFAAGTPLYETWTTAKPIEQFRPGDTVLSRDENDPAGAPVPKLVEEVFVGVDRILHLHVGGQVVRTTAMHPFWVEGKGWLEAGRLQPSDRLGSHDGQSVVVEEVFDTGETETVYNLRVGDYHTYFVGSPVWGWSAWAHNACSSTSGNNLFAKAGKQAHKEYYDAVSQFGYEAPFRLPSGRIADAVNVAEGVVRELKPNNVRALARGAKQVNGYAAELQQVFQRTFRTMVDGY
jgi:hypothetical protein